MPRNFLLLIAFLVVHPAFSQTVTGSWYGRADVIANGVNNNYLTELVLKQKDDEVEGIFGYYFKDSYQSFFVRGRYDKKTRYVYIKNLPILYFRSASTRDGIECPMSFEGRLLVSQAGSTISGSFISDSKYKYTCPQLRVRFLLSSAAGNMDSLMENEVTGQKFWQPQQEDFVVTTPSGAQPVTLQADATNANTALVAPARLKTNDDKLIEKFEKRENTYSKDLWIEGDSVRLSFYDNGDIDGDSITVFLNKKPVLVHQELTDRALNMYLALDSTRDVNEISMFADNLGLYPPNTALMIITDGINRYEVYLSSSFTQNASVRLRRKR